MTNLCAGLWINGRVEILSLDEGAKTSPTLVSFLSGNQIVTGQEALDQTAPEAIKNTVIGVKRLIGRKISDPVLIEESKKRPYRVVNDDADGQPMIVLNFVGVVQRFSPEFVTSKLLQKLKALAESRCSRPVKNVVMTVPSTFNDS